MRGDTQREPSGAPPLSVEIAIVAGVTLAGLAIRYLPQLLVAWFGG